jgi:hypothetical protein
VSIRTKTNFQKNIVNFFGAFGYFFCSLQWLWVIMLNFSLIKALILLISPNVDNQAAKPLVIFDLGPSPLSMIVAATITIIMVALTIYILIKMPSTIVKTSKKVVHETADNVTPLVLKIQHKKDTRRNYIKLTPRIILVIKTILIIAPVILTFTSQSMENQMIDSSVAVYVSFGLACFSAMSFMLQYILAKLLLIKRQDIW